jgi:hypothetical protein
MCYFQAPYQVEPAQVQTALRDFVVTRHPRFVVYSPSGLLRGIWSVDNPGGILEGSGRRYPFNDRKAIGGFVKLLTSLFLRENEPGNGCLFKRTQHQGRHQESDVVNRSSEGSECSSISAVK